MSWYWIVALVVVGVVLGAMGTAVALALWVSKRVYQ